MAGVAVLLLMVSGNRNDHKLVVCGGAWPKADQLRLKLTEAQIKAEIWQNRCMPRVKQPERYGANGKETPTEIRGQWNTRFTGESLIKMLAKPKLVQSIC
jgi:hypothetical protein